MSSVSLPSDIESSKDLFNDKTFLQGSIVSSVAYGIELTLFMMCFNILYRQFRIKHDKMALVLLIYVSLSFIIGTTYIVGIASVDQLGYVDNRYFPLGPALYVVVEPPKSLRLLSSVPGVAGDLLADALLIWRCITFYRGCGLPTWVILIFPSLIYGATFAMGTVFLVYVSFPASSVWALSTTKFAITYWSLSLSLNVTVTIAIVLRILIYRYRIVRALGSAHGKPYVTIAAMIIESASLFSITALIFLVTYVLNHPIQYVFAQFLSQIQIVAPMLIILRVAQGKAWTAGSGDMKSSDMLVQSPFVAAAGGARASSNILLSAGPRNGFAETMTVPWDALEHAVSASSVNSDKNIAK